MKGYVYKITNSVNDKVYIGATGNSLSVRFSGHKASAKSLDKTLICTAIRLKNVPEGQPKLYRHQQSLKLHTGLKATVRV